MKTRTATRVLARLAAFALVATGAAAVDVAVSAAPAAAAGCSYNASTITSLKVWNIDCYRGAYAYRSTATASTATRAGSWVAAGNWSYNSTLKCYQYPTMVKQ